MEKLLKHVVKVVICPLNGEPISAESCRTCAFYVEDDSNYVYCKFSKKEG